MPLSLSDLDGDYLMSSTTTDSFAVLLRRVAPELLPPTTVDTSVPELFRHGRTVTLIWDSCSILSSILRGVRTMAMTHLG